MVERSGKPSGDSSNKKAIEGKLGDSNDRHYSLQSSK